MNMIPESRENPSMPWSMGPVGAFTNGAFPERLIRGAVVVRSRNLASALENAVDELAKVREAFNAIAKVKKEPVVELWRMVAEQPAALRYEIYDVVEDAARNSAIQMGTVGLAFSGGGIRSASIQSGVPARRGSARTAEAVRLPFHRLGRRLHRHVVRGLGPARRRRKPKTPNQPPRTIQEYREHLTRWRTSKSSSTRAGARQGEAVRRWASPATIGDCLEAAVPQPCSERTVEEEPAPIYHLRAHSNYLAPNTGLLSINTWTMVSVYLRNLFLNQFILLPMMLAVIAVPRLGLLLFTHPTSGRMISLARGWLALHDSWPVLAVLLSAIVAMSITLPVPVDSLGAVDRAAASAGGQRNGRRSHSWALE